MERLQYRKMQPNASSVQSVIGIITKNRDNISRQQIPNANHPVATVNGRASFKRPSLFSAEPFDE
jgi:hypothetical protein